MTKGRGVLSDEEIVLRCLTCKQGKLQLPNGRRVYRVK